MAAGCITASAESFDWDGLNYEVAGENTCRVVASANATGNVVVPESVNYDDATYTVVEIGDMAFANCTGIETIQLPSSITAIGKKAFISCHALKAIEISENVATIGNEAFRNCTSLSDVRLDCNLKDAGNYLFMGCTSIATIEMPEGQTTVPNGCFYGCTALMSVEFPETLASIGEEAFSGCNSLVRASLPAAVQSVGRKSFYGCTGLKTIVLDAGLTSIGTQAFEGCKMVEDIFSYAVKPPVAEMYAFDTDIYGKATLSVPVGSIAVYRNTFPYQEFSTIIEDDNPENHILLTVRFPREGAIVTEENFGARVTFKIEAEEGWTTASIAFNGEDCTNDITETGYFTTPQLFADSELDIIFTNLGGIEEKTPDTDIRISVFRNIINITGAEKKDIVCIYDISDGRLLHEGTAKSITFNRHGAFALTVAGRTFKFAM